MAHTVHSIAKWVAKFTLTGVGYGVAWIRVPFVLAEINVTVTIGIHHPVCPVVRDQTEVVLPSGSHAVIIDLGNTPQGRRSNRLRPYRWKLDWFRFAFLRNWCNFRGCHRTVRRPVCPGRCCIRNSWSRCSLDNSA